ncbi:MAG: nucleoside triphosphate pyrophosphohydrolase family protein [Cyanophyceae cyanobacterium]
MDFNEYQALARSTAIYPKEHRVVYPALGLAGESGEVAEKIKKMLRDSIPEQDVKEALVKELGDVLWYVANLAHDLSITLDDIAMANVSKLLDRSERGVLQGSGDNR